MCQKRKPKLICSCLLILAMLPFCASCGARVGSTLHISKLPPVKLTAENKIATQDASLFIDQLKDTRTEAKVADFNGKSVLPQDDLSLVVREGLEAAFKAKGFSISSSAPVVVSGEIRDWSAQVRGGMPSGVDSKAALFLEVFDPANRRIYTGTYLGTASLQESSLNDKDVDYALGTAMQEALRQVLVDKKLIDLLASF